MSVLAPESRPVKTSAFIRAAFDWFLEVHEVLHAIYCHHLPILLSITNKMQRYTIFFITVNALHVPGGFSAHHQELKTVHTASDICKACLLLPLPYNVASCWLYLKEYINDARSHECQNHLPIFVVGN
jgi:hypothetical protein